MRCVRCLWTPAGRASHLRRDRRRSDECGLGCARRSAASPPVGRLVLVALSAVLVAGCNNSAAADPSRPTVRPRDASSVDAQACPGNASTVKTASDGDQPTVRVALIVPRTGAFPHWAQFGDGARALFETLNADADATVRFELTEIDDRLRATETKAAVEQAARDGIDVIVGIPSLANVDAVRSTLSEACIPLFTPAPVAVPAEGEAAAASAVPRNGNDVVVASGLDLREEVRILLAGAQPARSGGSEDEASGPRVSLIYQDNSYGRSYLNATKAAVREFDSELVASESFDPVSAPDPRDAVAAATKPKPDLLVIALEGASCPDALSFVPADLGSQIAVAGSCAPDPVIGDSGRDQVGVRAVVASLQPRDPDQRSLATAETFEKAIAQQDASAGESPADVTNLTAEGWNVASIAAAAVTQAHQAGSLSRTGILSAARSLEGPAPTMWPTGAGSLDGTGSATRSMLPTGQLSERTETFWRPIPLVDG